QGQTVTGQMAAGGQVSDITLKDETLSFTVTVGKRNKTRQVTGKVKGDTLEGQISNPDGPFVAHRQRQWGEPIELFNGKDLTGWKPLHDDERKHFKWSVRDGLLHSDGGSSNIV